MTDLRKAAEMALEFVEWLCGDDHSVKPKNNALKTREALRQALAQPEYQYEVVAMHENGTRTIKQTLIQKREWVGLTDEELRQAYCEVSGKEWCLGGMSNAHTFYEVIEAKLKEKNA